MLAWLFKLMILAEAGLGNIPCNPGMENNCFAVNKALGKEVFASMTEDLGLFSTNNLISSNKEGANLTITSRLDNPNLVSNFYLLYGKVEAEIKASRGQGVITSFYLQSDDLDEIDVELFGGNMAEFQTNFFIKGNTTTYDRGMFHSIEDPFNSWNKFAIEWTASRVNWWVNDRLVRYVDHTNPYGIPHSPMVVKFSLWAGGDFDNHPGTIEWAGGLTDYAQLPFSMYVRNVYMSDYSSGKLYYYGNRHGRWISVGISQDGKIPEFRPKTPQTASVATSVATRLVPSLVQALWSGPWGGGS